MASPFVLLCRRSGFLGTLDDFHVLIASNMDQFLLFGDSITQYAFTRNKGDAFGAELADAYIRRLDIVNRGLSGYNTRQALQVLPKIIPSPACARLRFMTVFFGANDARLPQDAVAAAQGVPQLQHVPLSEYVANLRAILTHPAVRAHENVRLLLITPPPVDERQLHVDAARAGYVDIAAPPAPTRNAATTASYAQAVRDVGRELSIEVVDLWTAMIRLAGGDALITAHGSLDKSQPALIGAASCPVNDVLQSFLADGLHLTKVGYQVLYSEVMRTIERRWPDQMPDRLKFTLPTWQDETAWATMP